MRTLQAIGPFPLVVLGLTVVVVAISTVALLLLAAYGADHLDRLPVASGTVVAVVPVYNEEPAVLRETVAALLAAEPPLRRIYVVDDGSKVPVEPIEPPGRAVAPAQRW